MALYHKYRPKSLDRIIGNQSVVDALRIDIPKKNKPHAFLLHGPTGCGKTTVGRIIAGMLNAVKMDFHEINSADFRGIDTIRDIQRQSRFKPMYSDSQVWLIDECHKLTSDAQHAMLKLLEDPPDHVYFILATTEPQKLLDTLKGRCSQYQMSLLSDHDMYRLLKRVIKKERRTIPRSVINQIIADSLGHPRNALQVLDQIIELDHEKMLAAAKRFAEEQSEVIELCRALLAKAPWKKISRILRELKEQEPEQVRRAIIGYCNSVILNGDNKRAAMIMEYMFDVQYGIGWPAINYACYASVK